MEKFWKELEIGEIHSRDRWQFELKSDFYPIEDNQHNIYTQEFYLFIPNSLQINEETYTKSQFYRDQTNNIRYKTPEFNLEELTDETQLSSPINKIKKLLDSPITDKTNQQIEYEFKLLANIIRSALRRQVLRIIKKSGNGSGITTDVTSLCNTISHLRSEVTKLLRQSMERFEDHPDRQKHLMYVDEFLSHTLCFFLTGLLDFLQDNAFHSEVNQNLAHLISTEKKSLKKRHLDDLMFRQEESKRESILYHQSLLKKFIMDPLLLKVRQFTLDQKYKDIIGAIAAGIAMFFFLLLFVWQGQVLVINSFPFIVITVILYILKDRMKEGLRGISGLKWFRWLSDKKTLILSPNQEAVLGSLRESFSFIPLNNVPQDIIEIRNKDFHHHLEAFKRPEKVVYYKKVLRLFPREDTRKGRRRESLNIIFRFNIHRFLTKLSDPMQEYLTFDPLRSEVVHQKLPKVYHLNIILKNTFWLENLERRTELKKFRLILDKNGIKRVEQIT